MTSGIYKTLPIEDITIDRAHRQRRDLKDLESLAESITNAGLINAPVVSPQLVLIAGERRLTACRDLLNWTHITVQIAATEDEVTAYLIELEENVKRSSLDWKDRCHSVAAYHDQRTAADLEWTNEKTADILGMSPSSVHDHRKLSEELNGEDTLILTAQKYSVARGIYQRKAARKEDVESEKLSSNLEAFFGKGEQGQVQTTAGPAVNPYTEAGLTKKEFVSVARNYSETPDLPTTPILNEDFTTWAPAYSGRKFNFIHCDFPYGIDHDTHNLGGTDAHGKYADSEDLFFSLMDTLAAAMTNVVADSAHLMFWFSMKYFVETKSRLEAMGWTVYENPLIWDKNNVGILADPSRLPRHTYEVCFFASRGDRKIVRAKADITNAAKSSNIHTSEKAEEMLTHYFSMLVDETTHMLDPTSGSGNALGVLRKFKGAECLGLEIDPEFWEKSCARHNGYWASKRGSL